MKATIAVTCFVSAIMLISAALTKEECEAPRPQSFCSTGVTPTYSYYFENRTGDCQLVFDCGGGNNKFPSLEQCRIGCPYGKYASSG
uniref:Putative tick kunitz 26 n=1 Tax=Ixodes ricinus TaxID=34613 RepID=V5IGN7_IXORI